MDPYYILCKQLEELNGYYKSSLFAFNQVQVIQNNFKEIKASISPDTADLIFKKPKVDHISRKRWRTHDPLVFLRELIHVRIMSILEVYLIENIKFIFLHNKHPFKSDTVIKITNRELLSYKTTTELYEKIINHESRQLSSGGFEKIVQFYTNKLRIDIASIYPGRNVIEEYYDRRHLLVHRLGNTDHQFRSKYNTPKKGITIEELYLTKLLEDILKYTSEVRRLTDELIANDSSQHDENGEREIIFKFKSLISGTPDFLNPKFEFWANDKLISIKDIVVKIKVLEDDYIEVTVGGAYTLVTEYYKVVKRTIKQKKKFKSFQMLKMMDDGKYKGKEKGVKKARKKKKKYIRLTDGEIEQIKNELPQQPWVKGIHKIVAENLNLPKRTVQTGISLLIRRGIFKNQLDGIIIDT